MKTEKRGQKCCFLCTSTKEKDRTEKSVIVTSAKVKNYLEIEVICNWWIDFSISCDIFSSVFFSFAFWWQFLVLKVTLGNRVRISSILCNFWKFLFNVSFNALHFTRLENIWSLCRLTGKKLTLFNTWMWRGFYQFLSISSLCENKNSTLDWLSLRHFEYMSFNDKWFTINS